MLGELPALIAAGYEQVPEEDLVRLKWWGLYHDKPKIGTFMLRIKLPAGRVTPEQLRAVGELSLEYGKGSGELSTRQTIQLHYLELASLPEVFRRLDEVGLTTVGACGDAVRNVTGCPVAGLAHDELFDVTPVIEEVTKFFYGNPDYSDLPRKHKITVSACAHRCNAPEINCIALVGAIRDGEPGFAVLVGGGLSSVPRLARDLGVFIRVDEALPVLCALLDAWKEDLRYRVSRVKARIKFMVDDLGPEGMRAEVERRLGYALPDFELDAPPPMTDHIGVQPEKQDGLVSIGVPVKVGLISGEQMVAVAELASELGQDVRVTRQQNFVLTSDRDRRRRARRRAARGARPAADRQPAPRRGDRLHRRAALQLRRDRDEVAARRARRAPRGPLRRGARRPEAEPRRLPPRLRAPLGGRPRLPGLDRAQRGRRAPPGLRPAPARRPRPRRRDRPAGLPPGPGRGARRHGHRPAGRVAAATRRRRELPRVLRPLERRGARPPGRAGACEEPERGGGAA